MIKIIAVGNSFSQDATTYLDRICESAGIDVYVRNLYIGGCELALHHSNLESDRTYEYQTRGIHTDKRTTLKDGLACEKWDIVTFQQASHHSGIEETYYPYINELSKYVNEALPGAKQYIHETWAYEIDSTHPHFVNYNNDQLYMYNALKAAYENAAKSIGAPLIPCGDVIQLLRTKAPFDYKNGGLSLCRDGFHLSLDYGRYTAGAVWYEALLGKDVRKSTYAPEGTDAALISLIRETVHEICNNK